ncbi:protein of unknown function [Shewanella benthica]|uniref:Uncharacterized protein n=1 Tax=Shewanella benthica TaxID=43661 RepID=A0A330M3L0_9GAMM|nr:protein of unknown function [Shewanella benthica]
MSLDEQTVTDYFTLEIDIPTSQFMLTEHQASLTGVVMEGSLSSKQRALIL